MRLFTSPEPAQSIAALSSSILNYYGLQPVKPGYLLADELTVPLIIWDP